MKLLRHVLTAASLAATCFISTAVAEQAYPSRPVTLVVPFTPGGATDTVARIAADGLSQRLGQTVIVVNKPGAGGAIGIGFVAKAPADGYTLALGSIGPMAINPSLYANLPYNTRRDFAPIIKLADTPLVLVTRPDKGPSTVDELLAAIRAKPNALNYGSAGVGNITHLAAAYFLNRSDASATHVPYQGSAPAIQDFLGGQLDFMFDPLPSATPYVQSRRYKALAVTSAKRSSVLPDVPSLQELGYGPFDIRSWFGIFAPAGTPEAIVVKLNHGLNAIFAEPAVKDKLKQLGYDSEPNTSDAFDSFVKEEIERWHVIVDQVGAKAD